RESARGERESELRAVLPPPLPFDPDISVRGSETQRAAIDTAAPALIYLYLPSHASTGHTHTHTY
ncbi:rCG51475, partial [Rattus norvegicus]